jgi:hypothetical protein
MDRYKRTPEQFFDEDDLTHVVTLKAMSDPLKNVADQDQRHRPPPEMPRSITKLHRREGSGQG